MVRRRGRVILVWLALASAMTAGGACSCEDTPPIDETFDGNVVVGDASPPRDALPRDASDTGLVDAEPTDAADAETSEAGADAEAPDADTPPVDAGPDCAPTTMATLAATAAVAQVDVLAGLVVDVTGTATTSTLRCQGTRCADGGVCCDVCVADVTIDGVLRLGPSECFPSVGCAGSECAQLCRPAVLGVSQRFRGRLLRDGGAAVLELIAVEP